MLSDTDYKSHVVEVTVVASTYYGLATEAMRAGAPAFEGYLSHDRGYWVTKNDEILVVRRISPVRAVPTTSREQKPAWSAIYLVGVERTL